MNPYPAVLVEGPWIKPAGRFDHIQDETVRRLEIEVARKEREALLKPKPWALRAVADVVEEGEWQ